MDKNAETICTSDQLSEVCETWAEQGGVVKEREGTTCLTTDCGRERDALNFLALMLARHFACRSSTEYWQHDKRRAGRQGPGREAG